MDAKIKSPAKLNLSLEVLGKRPDGYHDIRSLMVPIDRYDELTLDIEDGEEIACVSDHPGVPNGPANLAYRAASAFMEATGERFGALITIRKSIPVGAGLGGGSSNAASILKELNRMRGEPLNEAQLTQVAAGIGSDVPFFLKAGAQWAEGRGELLREGPKLPDWTYVVVFPGFEISARWAYNHMPLTFSLENNKLDIFQVGGVRLTNQLEAAVLAAYPKVGEIKERMLAVGARAALMTGSGPSVFGLFENRPAAEEAIRKIGDQPDTTVFLAQMIKQAP